MSTRMPVMFLTKIIAIERNKFLIDDTENNISYINIKFIQQILLMASKIERMRTITHGIIRR